MIVAIPVTRTPKTKHILFVIIYTYTSLYAVGIQESVDIHLRSPVCHHGITDTGTNLALYGPCACDQTKDYLSTRTEFLVMLC